MEWFEEGRHAPLDFVPFNPFHRIFRKVMAELLKRVQTYERGFDVKICHVQRRTKSCREWCWIMPSAYVILKQKGWLFRG